MIGPAWGSLKRADPPSPGRVVGCFGDPWLGPGPWIDLDTAPGRSRQEPAHYQFEHSDSTKPAYRQRLRISRDGPDFHNDSTKSPRVREFAN